MTCRGIHDKYKRTRRVGNSNYLNGNKRCNHCEVFLAWSGLYCPCCKLKLRTKPRNKYYKEKINRGVKRIG